MAKQKKKVTSNYALLETIQSKSRRNVILSSSVIFLCAVAILASFWFAQSQRSIVYVIDNDGISNPARLAKAGERKDLEISNHLNIFHQLMFSMIPNAEVITSNVESALNLADRSAYDYYADLKEQKFYSRLISNGISQEIILDSVKSNITVYPYRAEVFGKVYVARTSNISKYDFHSTCKLTDVGRTEKNPNGLRIENFTVDKYELIESRKKNK